MNTNKIYITYDELPKFTQTYFDKLEGFGIPEEDRMEMFKIYLKNSVILKYSKDWQDENLSYWIDTILNVPGGYWIVQDLIRQPHVEYEHYNQKSKMSYEKGNVSLYRANIELKKSNRANFNYFHTIKEDNNVIEVEVDGSFQTEKANIYK